MDDHSGRFHGLLLADDVPGNLVTDFGGPGQRERGIERGGGLSHQLTLGIEQGVAALVQRKFLLVPFHQQGRDVFDTIHRHRDPSQN